MRRIDRVDLDASVRLVRDGEDATDELERLWLADPANFKPEINRDIYGSVKNTLLHMQNAKCCYCEVVISAGFHGDVEHYRPKKGVTEDPAHGGYWWLAYEWSNLLLSCDCCNRTHKKNHFPLSASGIRSKTTTDNLMLEEPLLLDPTVDEPNEHIGYREHVLFPKTERGKATIEKVGLNRKVDLIEDFETRVKILDGLIGRRERHYQKLKHHWEQLERLSDTLESLVEIGSSVLQMPPEFWEKLDEIQVTVDEEWRAIEGYISDPQEPYLAMSVAALDENFTLSFEL